MGGTGLSSAYPEPPKALTAAQLQAKAKYKSVSSLCQKKKKSKTVKELCQRWETQNA
jgi:hypothetical protein